MGGNTGGRAPARAAAAGDDRPAAAAMAAIEYDIALLVGGWWAADETGAPLGGSDCWWTGGEEEALVVAATGEGEALEPPLDPEDLRGGEHLGELAGCTPLWWVSWDLGLVSSLGEMLLFLLLVLTLLLLIMSDSILLQALVSMAKGLILESIWNDEKTIRVEEQVLMKPQ